MKLLSASRDNPIRSSHSAATQDERVSTTSELLAKQDNLLAGVQHSHKFKATYSPPPTPFKKTIQAFNMTMKNFKNSSARIHDSISKCKFNRPMHRYSGYPRGSNLELLRKTLQPSINREMTKIFQDYYELFSMAHENIVENIGVDDESKPEEFLMMAMRLALDEAKKSIAAYCQPPPPQHKKRGRLNRPPPTVVDAEKMLAIINQEKFRWDPARIHSGTCFTLGPRANKALGLGTTRGRLYIKHPEIFKYPADQSDKQWLAENGFMSGIGGKVYLLFTADIVELANSKEYKNMPGVNPGLISGFLLPELMVNKMREYLVKMLEYVQAGRPHPDIEGLYLNSSHTNTPVGGGGPTPPTSSTSVAAGLVAGAHIVPAAAADQPPVQ